MHGRSMEARGGGIGPSLRHAGQELKMDRAKECGLSSLEVFLCYLAREGLPSVDAHTAQGVSSIRQRWGM